MAGALEGLYNHALPIHTPATLLASSTAQGQTYPPQVRNTIHCFHFGWEHKQLLETTKPKQETLLLQKKNSWVVLG